MSESVSSTQKPLEGAVVTKLDDIKYNEANKSMAILAWIPLIGLILMFVEKNDKFVRYNGAQSTVIGIIEFIFSIVWGMITAASLFVFGLYSILSLVSTVVWVAVMVLVVYGMYMTLNGKRLDLPVISGLALKLMDMIK